MSNDNKKDPKGSDAQIQESWQRVQLARRADRPHTLDYIRQVFTDFVELHGDRAFGDDPAIVAGLASFEGRTVVVLGHQKGANTKENVARHFGMAHPEGYRKALRLMRHAEKFGFPLITFIDTPGAEPGLQGEERGMALAIADDLLAMLTLRVPIVTLVIGEGGSGGALALGIGDRILMLENAIYSVASPESAATILWRNAAQAPQAAAAMRIYAQDLHEFGVVDRVIPEPEGGAHADPAAMMERVAAVLREELAALDGALGTRDEAALHKLLADRQAKYTRMGVYSEQGAPPRAKSRAHLNGTGPAESVPPRAPKAPPGK